MEIISSLQTFIIFPLKNYRKETARFVGLLERLCDDSLIILKIQEENRTEECKYLYEDLQDQMAVTGLELILSQEVHLAKIEKTLKKNFRLWYKMILKMGGCYFKKRRKGFYW